MTCKQWPANCFLVKTCRFSCFVLQRTCQCFVSYSWPEALETFGNARLVQRPKARMSLRYAKQIGHANLKPENMFLHVFLHVLNHILPDHTISIHILPSLRGAVGAKLTLSWGQKTRTTADPGISWGRLPDLFTPGVLHVMCISPWTRYVRRFLLASHAVLSIHWLNETIWPANKNRLLHLHYCLRWGAIHL